MQHAGETDEHAAHQHGGHQAADLQLNHGQRWQTDAPLREGMERIRAAVAAAADRTDATGGLDASSGKVLADEIDAAIAFMVSHCRLPPQADANLHILIGQMAEAATLAESLSSRRAHWHAYGQLWILIHTTSYIPTGERTPGCMEVLGSPGAAPTVTITPLDDRRPAGRRAYGRWKVSRSPAHNPYQESPKTAWEVRVDHSAERCTLRRQQVSVSTGSAKQSSPHRACIACFATRLTNRAVWFGIPTCSSTKSPEPLDRRLADGLTRLAAVARQLDWRGSSVGRIVTDPGRHPAVRRQPA